MCYVSFATIQQLAVCTSHIAVHHQLDEQPHLGSPCCTTSLRSCSVPLRSSVADLIQALNSCHGTEQLRACALIKYMFNRQHLCCAVPCRHVMPPAMQICFALAFFVCRIALGPFVVYHTLQSGGSHPVVKVGLAPCLMCSPSSKHRQWRIMAPCSLTHVLVINRLPLYSSPN